MYAQQPTTAMGDDKRPNTLLPPAVTALKQEAAVSNNARQAMERSVSQDMREQREDLKEAAEHSLNVIMDLDLDNRIRYVTPQWKDVIGSAPQEVVGKSVMDIVYGGADGFAETIESVKKYDSRSHMVRFSVRMGPHSVLRKRRSRPAAEETPEQALQSPGSVDHEEEQILNLEAQGIMIYDRTTGDCCTATRLYVLTMTDYVDDPPVRPSRSDHRPPGSARRVSGCGS
jgi:serine/threonine-protein kinase RIM15